MSIFQQRFSLTILIFLAFSESGVAQDEQSGADGGSGDPIAIFRDAISDAADALGVEEAAADWLAKERRIATQSRLGLVSGDVSAARYYSLGRVYYQAFRYEKALVVLQRSIDAAPDSYGALQSLLLIGNIYYGNFADPARSVKPFQEADRLMVKLLADKSFQSEESQDLLMNRRGTVLGRVGLAFSATGNTDESIRYLHMVTDSSELSASVSPTNLLIYNRQIGRIAAKKKDFPAQKAAYRAVGKLLDSGRIPPGKILSNRLEILRYTWPNPDDAKRIAALELLWQDENLVAARNIIDVGDELTMHYFFSDPTQVENFSRVSKELLSRIRKIISKSNRKTFTEPDTLFVRNLLMAVDVARLQGETKNVTLLTQEFEKAYKGRSIRVGIPSNRPPSQAERLYTIYLTTMKDHAQAAGRIPEKAEARPTLAK